MLWHKRTRTLFANQSGLSPPSNMKSVKFGNFLEEIPVHFIQYSEIISAAKPLLNFSRLFGVPGFSYFDSVVFKGGFCNFLNIWNALLLLNQIFLLVVSLSKGEDFVRKSGTHIIMRLHVICIHLWSLFYTKKLAKALRDSPALENRLKIYKEPEYILSLRRKCIAVTVLYVILSFGISFKSFFIDIFSKGLSPLKAWESYGNNCNLDENTFFHSSVTTVYCIFSTLATNFVWVFGDFLLIILSIIMAEMFRRLNKGVSSMQPEKFSALEIDLVREHHGLTSKMVSDFDDAISSLNLINAIFNTAFLVTGSYALLLGFKGRNSKTKAAMAAAIEIACKLAVAAFKFALGLIAASVLHRRAHTALAHVRSWPMAREFQDFSLHNGRASVIHAFLGQLSNPSIGFTIGKFITITAATLTMIALGVGIFFVFTRITISSCSRNSNGRLELENNF